MGLVLTVQAHPQLMPSPSTTNSYLTNLHHHHQLTLNKVPDKYPRTCTKSVQKVVCFFCAIALLVVISLIILVENGLTMRGSSLVQCTSQSAKTEVPIEGCEEKELPPLLHLQETSS
ncbi:unnamed protein product [Darwinula stevensoni]|uniref:Uncharacterized protein n=1 Tax=Darwinula stevensoni TaxID=69355 RepID=A0A7R8X3W6_9CRUS|nr:unnamed protein product [Darwinula stevensoni]CAG0884825.1 unnamed protein product [Darwinula stevensoni]